MRRLLALLVFISLISCTGGDRDKGTKIITVSIAPFKYFVEAIAGNDYTVNVMVPAGADPHTYEPYPVQISDLARSSGYISNGFLGFEMNWLDKFYETNPSMKKLNLGDVIERLAGDHEHEGGHTEIADPHYWVSPKCAFKMAESVRAFLSDLNPSQKEKYSANYKIFMDRIGGLDSLANSFFSNSAAKSFMIYHPNLAYIARDYGLEEIPVEYEGKEPSAARLRDLIDRARTDKLKTIFVQLEYDTKNAKSIAGEIGARVILINPLSEDWYSSTKDLIGLLNQSLTESSK